MACWGWKCARVHVTGRGEPAIGTKRIGTKKCYWRSGLNRSAHSGNSRTLFVCKSKPVQVASSIDDITAVILGVRFHRGRRARLIAVNGIDGSGKGYVSARLAEKLAGNGFRVAVIAADGWLNLPNVRFGGDDPGEHFYSHAFRFEEMFSRLIEPLARDGSSHLTAEYVEETATCYRKHVYEFDDVDLILLEGIFCSNGSFTNAMTSVSGSTVASRPRWNGPSAAHKRDCRRPTQSLPMSASTLRLSEYISSEIVPVNPLTSYM